MYIRAFSILFLVKACLHRLAAYFVLHLTTES